VILTDEHSLKVTEFLERFLQVLQD